MNGGKVILPIKTYQKNPTNKNQNGEGTWITKEIRYMIKQKIKLYNRMKKTGNNYDFILYKNFKNRLKLKIKN